MTATVMSGSALSTTALAANTAGWEPGEQPLQQNIVQMAANAACRFGKQAAFTCMGTELDFITLQHLSDCVAHWLVHVHQLQPGDRVALMLPNLLQFPVVALGVLKARGVLVNINPLYTPYEIQAQLQDSGATLMIVLANVASNASGAIPTTAVRKVIVTEVGDLLGPIKGPFTNFAVHYLKHLVKPYRFAALISLRAVLKAGAELVKHKPPLSGDFNADELAVLQYTGGTTGKMKGAMLSHRNLLSNVRQVEVSMAGSLPGPGAVMVAPLPLYHIYAFTLNFLATLVCGHHALLIPDPRDSDAFIAALREVPMRGFVGISTLYGNLLDQPAFRTLDFSHLSVATSGGMALSPQVAVAWRELTRTPILEGYGLTECSPLVSCNTMGQQRDGTVGKPIAGTRLKLQAASGETAGSNEPGEICIQGPQVMRGYWNNAEETALVFDEQGWLHTGDIGVLDAEGFLTIVDRLKDLIVISGFNVYPNEIEDYVCTHPAIRDACVIAVGSETAPSIRLFVVSTDTALTAADVLEYCRRGLAPYKVPRSVEFRSALPKSALGKVLRRQLRPVSHSAGS